MIDRYTRAEMGAIWTQESRFANMLAVEVAVAEVQASLKMIPRAAAVAIKEKSCFNVERIQQIEKETKHDVIAFVSNVAENVGEYGRFVHFGLTSSDVLDTAFSLQVQKAKEVLDHSLDQLENAFRQIIKKHTSTLCAGRTHGMFAEPTTFGLKMSGFYSEFLRNRARLQQAFHGMRICKLSGAVGTFSSLSEEVESKLAKKLKLIPETIATQVIPRDRHAEMISALAMLGSGYERLAIELRHLQRSEVSEVVEGFSKGQKGSSAMPHKKNPISAENITGCARLLRSYQVASMENIALWHERDISHSSVERLVFPDAFILADYITVRMSVLLDGLQVLAPQMLENIERSRGQLFSSQVLLALVNKGLDRELAYYHVQRVCHDLKPKEHLKTKILKDEELKKLLSAKELEKIFQGASLVKQSERLCQSVLRLGADSHKERMKHG